ncbi:extracellular matrix regulator RemB [Cytobacillus sp. FJAT-53684]|uniref:Extracellular matrix regulator RemB n=1 Tax=Cytobacillus mangrovibacter TaxID=3299024 RepID=A0ABW6K4I3_9BACI
MYIHVGEDILVRSKDIIAILDKESFNSSKYVEEFLECKNHSIVNLSKGSFKSVVITAKEVYFSPLASGTLKKRSQQLAIHEY